MLDKLRKGIKKFVNDRIQACKETLQNAQNRLILGLIFVGAGAGLIVSAYLRVEN